jgi:hypothetical protein
MERKKNSSKKMDNTLTKSLWKKDSAQVYNLQDIFNRLNRDFFAQKLTTQIMWARQSAKARCYRRLGCYSPLQNLIKIHPLLDDQDIPEYFIEYVVYHEMLHAVYPPIKAYRRRAIHHRKFLEMEKIFPQYDKAKAWEKTEGKKKFF